MRGLILIRSTGKRNFLEVWDIELPASEFLARGLHVGAHLRLKRKDHRCCLDFKPPKPWGLPVYAEGVYLSSVLAHSFTGDSTLGSGCVVFESLFCRLAAGVVEATAIHEGIDASRQGGVLPLDGARRFGPTRAFGPWKVGNGVR